MNKSSTSSKNHSLQYISIENSSLSSFHSSHHHSPISISSSSTTNSTTTLPSLTSKQKKSLSHTSFNNNNHQPPPSTYLPIGIGERTKHHRTYSNGQRAPSVPPDAFQKHHIRSHRSLFDSSCSTPTMVLTSGYSMKLPQTTEHSDMSSISCSSGTFTDNSPTSNYKLNSTFKDQQSESAFDDETTLFVNIIKKDLSFIQKKINELKYEEKHNRHRSDDIENYSHCIYQSDQYRTRYSLLELFVNKLSEMQQILMQKTDKLIPVSKRFKTNMNEKISTRLQRFADVSERIMDIVENNKSSSTRVKIQTHHMESQTMEQSKRSATPKSIHKETTDVQVNTDKVDMSPLESENQELKKLVRYMQWDKEQAQRTIKELSESISTIQTDKQEEHNTILNQLKKNIEKLKEENIQILENQEEIIERHRRDDLSNIEQQLQEKIVKIEKIESRLYFKDKEVEALQDELDSLRSKSTKQKEKEEAEAWKLKYQELIQNHNELENKFKDISDECYLVKEHSKKEETRYKETIETMKKIQEDQSRLQTESYKHDTKKLQSKLEAAEKIAMQKEFQYEELVKNYQIQSIELGISHKQNESLKEQVKTLQREKQKLLENVAKEQHVDVRQEIEIIKREYEEKSKAINEKMKDLQMGHVMQLKALNDTFTQERKMLQRKADKFKQRCDLLETRLEESDNNR